MPAASTVPQLGAPLPKDGSVYDWVWDKVAVGWRHWMDLLPGGGDAPVPESTPFTSIIVPTVDTVRYGHLLALLVGAGRHVLLTGPTGTGKTVYVKAALEALDRAAFARAMQTAFSAQTSANMVQVMVVEGGARGQLGGGGGRGKRWG